MRMLRSEPVYRQVLTLSGEPGFADQAEFQVEDLRRLSIRWVVFHRDRPRLRLEEYLRSIGLRMASQDDEVVIYEVQGA